MHRNLLTLCLLLSPLTVRSERRSSDTSPLPSGFAECPALRNPHRLDLSVEPKVDGSIDSSDEAGNPQKAEGSDHTQEVKLHLCVGSWRKSSFSKMAANLSTRTAFVRNLTTFLRRHQLDGADLDWEP